MKSLGVAAMEPAMPKSKKRSILVVQIVPVLKMGVTRIPREFALQPIPFSTVSLCS